MEKIPKTSQTRSQEYKTYLHPVRYNKILPLHHRKYIERSLQLAEKHVQITGDETKNKLPEILIVPQQ